MKRYLLLLMCTAVFGSGYAQDFDDDETIPAMGVVSVRTKGQGGFPAGKKVYVADANKRAITSDEWQTFYKCLSLCLLDAGYAITASEKDADIILTSELSKVDTTAIQIDGESATYMLKLLPFRVGKETQSPLLYNISTIVSPDNGWKDVFVYTFAALLDNEILFTPHDVDFWLSLDDVEFRELLSVTMMKRLAN
ncbi:MAG: hypothetical protein ACI392_06110 [Paludibacteraceae bacterium]